MCVISNYELLQLQQKAIRIHYVCNDLYRIYTN